MTFMFQEIGINICLSVMMKWLETIEELFSVIEYNRIFSTTTKDQVRFCSIRFVWVYHHDFNEEYFLDWCDEFSELMEIELLENEGVSGLIKKEDWDYIGGNDDRFINVLGRSDLFIRKNEGFKMVQLINQTFIILIKNKSFSDDDFTKDQNI